MTRHFLNLSDAGGDAIAVMLNDAMDRKNARIGWPKGKSDADAPLAGHILAMVFEKNSTRTRTSFEMAMKQLGGDSIFMASGQMQLGRGETPADTAKVLSRYVDAIMLRTDNVQKIRELAAHATVPVINGLTDVSHPCQLMADVMTFEEHRGPIAGQILAWTGDGNNVAQSFIQAAARFGFTLRLATPPELAPPAEVIAWARAQGAKVELTHDPIAAVRDARCVVTDTWVSMADERDGRADSRHNLLAPYQLNSALLKHAAPDAIVMHCLPAHRGEEITDEVMDGPQSVVFDEAENRLHAQKGVLLWALGLA